MVLLAEHEGWEGFEKQYESITSLRQALVAAAERDAIIELAETPIGEYEIVVACGTEPETRHIPRYLIGQFLIEAIRARSNT